MSSETNSSKDDQTGMRRGIAIEAILSFLAESGHVSHVGEQDTMGGSCLEGNSKDKPIVLE